MIKRKLTVIICLILCAIALCGCAGGYDLTNDGALNYQRSATIWDEDTNTYLEIIENDFCPVAQSATSYFSIDVNTASYPNLRKLITNNYSITPDAVRIEEMLNYFSYDYARPNDKPLAIKGEMMDCPWSDNYLLTVGIAAEEVQFEQVRNNLVFLIDVSGSMASSDRLPLVQQAFTLLAQNLSQNDTVSIVTYAGTDTVALEGANCGDVTTVVNTIEDLMSGGSTAGAAGIKTAYDLARKYFIEGGNNRVILATDGDFNVGVSSDTQLENLIRQQRKSGVYLSIIGVGTGNLQSEKMEKLSLAGNGTWAYVDSVTEARRILVEQIGGTLVTVAKDVKCSVEFNADMVEQYRLIGYENKLLTQEQFADDKTDAGEIGSGHTLTVVFEVKLTAQGKQSISQPLLLLTEFAKVIVRYKDPSQIESSNQDQTSQITCSIYQTDYTAQPDADQIFVSCVVEFGLILRNSSHKGNADLQSVYDRLTQLDLANDEVKAEFRTLVQTYMNRA